MFRCVGVLMLFLCSLCCLRIACWYLCVHHFLEFLFGIFSYFSIVFVIAICILWRCCEVGVLLSEFVMEFVIVVSMSCRMVYLCVL